MTPLFNADQLATEGQTARTKLLVSVRNAQEARAAVTGSADLIDVKEPSRGPLGAADIAVVRRVAEVVASRGLVTAAAGELAEAPRLESYADSGVSMIKLGLSGLKSWQQWFEQARRQLPAGVTLTPVAYADHQAANSPPAEQVIQQAHQLGLEWVLVDTFDKRSGGLFQHFSANRVEHLVEQTHSKGMRIALAGRLDIAGVAQACEFGADVVGVRGAACGGDRDADTSAAIVRQLATQVRSAHHLAKKI